MTTASNQKSQPEDAGDKPPPEPDAAGELDTEIVRDLEADQVAADVRGAACPTSRPITKDR